RQETLGDPSIPEVGVNGEGTEQADAGPVHEAVRADDLSVELGCEHGAGIGTPARANDVGLPAEGQRIGEADEGAEGETKDTVGGRDLALLEGADDRGGHAVSLTCPGTGARDRGPATSRAHRPR